MVSWSQVIIDPDEKFEIEEWIITMCDLDYDDYLSNKDILTKEILEEHLENIVKHLPKDHHIEYIVLGGLLMEVGAEIPDYDKYRIVESINFEMNKDDSKLSNIKKLRKIFFTDYKDKILNYQSGQKTYLINLKLSTDFELNETIFGLEEFHIRIAQDKFRNINYINLDASNLDEIPSEITKFKELKVLSLENNKLESIPDPVFKFKHLESLYLNGNSLNSILDNISQLSNLKLINLANNNIETLPQSILSLKSLKELYLQNNNLKNIPISLGNLQNLGLINLENNPIEDIPKNLIPNPNLIGVYRTEANYRKSVKRK